MAPLTAAGARVRYTRSLLPSPSNRRPTQAHRQQREHGEPERNPLQRLPWRHRRMHEDGQQHRNT